MSQYDLSPCTRTVANDHFMVHVECDAPDCFGLLIEPKAGAIAFDRVQSFAAARGLLSHLAREYRHRSTALRAARRLLDGPLSQP